jgi:hypothetical protein
MKKIYSLIALILLFASCGSGDEPTPATNNQKVPEESIAAYSAQIILNDTIFLSQLSSFSLKTENTFDKVEYYIDGELIGTSINKDFSISWTPQNILAGEHDVEAVCYISGNTHKFKNKTFLKIKVGDKYAGGIVIDVLQSGTKGLVAAEYDLIDHNDDYRFRWGITGLQVEADNKDGQINTELIIKALSNENSTFAIFLKDGIKINGFYDWYVPSKEESEKIKKEIVPNLHVDKYYWTSTETDSERAVFFHHRGSLMGTNQRKNYLYHIRLVRKF